MIGIERRGLQLPHAGPESKSALLVDIVDRADCYACARHCQQKAPFTRIRARQLSHCLEIRTLSRVLAMHVRQVRQVLQAGRHLRNVIARHRAGGWLSEQSRLMVAHDVHCEARQSLWQSPSASCSRGDGCYAIAVSFARSSASPRVSMTENCPLAINW